MLILKEKLRSEHLFELLMHAREILRIMGCYWGRDWDATGTLLGRYWDATVQGYIYIYVCIYIYI